jgi:pSer/pThr/pTyr-binding forkhead associated (FHA) protein
MPTNDAPITAIRLLISGADVSLGQGEHLLGRAAECAVLVEDPLASRRHAAITVAPDRVTIRDLGSRNGVLVNGSDVDDNHTLCDGDLIAIGAQILVVAQVCRAGQPVPQRPAPHRGAPLGRIAVQRRSALETGSFDAQASSTTTLNQGAPTGRPAGAWRMMAEAAARAIATGRAEKAEKLLEAPLQEVLETLRAGHEVECEVIDLAVQQALALCEHTSHGRWDDFVHSLYDQMRIPMPLAVADQLALAMQRKKP